MADLVDTLDIRMFKGDAGNVGWVLGFVVNGEFKPFLAIKGEFDNVGVFKNAFDKRYGAIKNHYREEREEIVADLASDIDRYFQRPQDDTKADFSPGTAKGGMD